MVVLFFVVLTSAALLDAYIGPDLQGSGKHHAAVSLLGLVVFFVLVGPKA